MDEIVNKSNAIIQATIKKIVRQLPLSFDYEWRLNGIVGFERHGKNNQDVATIKNVATD